MRFRVSVITGLLVLVFSSALVTAQEEDLIGIFFDEAGTQTSINTTEPNQTVTFYLVLLEPNHAEGIHSWECIIEGRTEGQAYLVDWQLRGEAINYDQPPRFFVSLTTPLPSTGAVVLMSATALVIDPDTEALFYLHPYDPPSLSNPPGFGYPVTTPVYGYGGGNHQSLGWTSGCEAEPVARINDDGEDPVWSLADLPEEILFGYVPVGETEIRFLDLENTGDVVLSGQIDINGDDFMYRHSGEYWTGEPQWFRIEPGNELRVSVRVESVTDEGYTGSLDISVCGETTTIILVKPAYYVCEITPHDWDFGCVEVGESSQRTFEVRNGAGSQLEGQVVIPDSCSGFTVVDGGEPFSLLHDETHYFTIEFVPVEWGLHECDAFVSEECADVGLRGVGVDPPGDCWYYQNGCAYIIGWVGSGSGRGVAVAGNYAYVAVSNWGGGGSLRVIDISDPESPVIVGAVETPGGANGVAVAGNYAYVADYYGLQVIDISDPESPVIVGAVDTPGSARGVAVAGNYAYVADGGSGLQVIDISVPESPVIVGAVDTPGDARGVAVAGNYAYVADDGSGLQVIDIANPENPWIVGVVDTPGSARGVAVAGNYAYVAGGGLQVIDISVPESPVIVGAVGTPGSARGVAVAGNYAYVAAYYSGLQVIDISDPESPVIVGAVDIWDGEERVVDVVVAGNFTYLVSGDYYGYGVLAIAWRQCEGVVSIEPEPDLTDPEDEVPVSRLALTVNPNPFNPQTTVTFSLEKTGLAKIGIYDLTGRLVTILANQLYGLGTHTLTWNGHDYQGRAMPSGTYIVRLETESGVESRKVMLVR